MKAVYPGSFDPMTMGHLDILRRTVKTYDEVTLLLAINPAKQPKFPLHLRMQTIDKVVARLKKETGKFEIYVDYTDKLVADYVNENKIDVIIRGIRDYTDLKYELNIERFNQRICDAETAYFTPRPQFTDTSSSFVNEFIKWGRLDSIKDLVPPEIFTMIQEHHSANS
jgi:pantetheine-phosphate adenylyltransferase